jgi:hypothetical protein
MPENIAIPMGSIENIIVDVKDSLGILTDLGPSGVKYDIRKEDTITWIVQGVTAVVNLMRVYCLVDTTLSAYATQSASYELFITFNNLPEKPRLGPFEFDVNL